jgi:hypothetical protein
VAGLYWRDEKTVAYFFLPAAAFGLHMLPGITKLA